jgi:flagellar biosynthetic protein FliR
VPVGQVGLAPGTTERLIVLSGAVFVAAVKMALPVLAALLLADLGMAILARVAPQFNLFAVGFPAKVMIGLAAVLAALPFILPRFVALFRTLPSGMQMLAG